MCGCICCFESGFSLGIKYSRESYSLRNQMQDHTPKTHQKKTRTMVYKNEIKNGRSSKRAGFVDVTCTSRMKCVLFVLLGKFLFVRMFCRNVKYYYVHACRLSFTTDCCLECKYWKKRKTHGKVQPTIKTYTISTPHNIIRTEVCI